MSKPEGYYKGGTAAQNHSVEKQQWKVDVLGNSSISNITVTNVLDYTM